MAPPLLRFCEAKRRGPRRKPAQIVYYTPPNPLFQLNHCLPCPPCVALAKQGACRRVCPIRWNDRVRLKISAELSCTFTALPIAFHVNSMRMDFPCGFLWSVRPAKNIEKKITRPLYHFNRRAGRHLKRGDNIVIILLQRLQQIIKVIMIRPACTAKRPVVIATAVFTLLNSHCLEQKRQSLKKK